MHCRQLVWHTCWERCSSPDKGLPPAQTEPAANAAGAGLATTGVLCRAASLCSCALPPGALSPASRSPFPLPACRGVLFLLMAGADLPHSHASHRGPLCPVGNETCIRVVFEPALRSPLSVPTRDRLASHSCLSQKPFVPSGLCDLHPASSGRCPAGESGRGYSLLKGRPARKVFLLQTEQEQIQVSSNPHSCLQRGPTAAQ